MNKEIEQQLTSQIIDNEFYTAKRNKEAETAEFEGYIDLLDSVREPKQYDWMSDVRIPEFISHVLTQSSIDASQYFQSRNFVEVYLEDSSDEALACADAVKEIVNRTLNQKHLFHYSKYMRAKTLNNVSGRVYARCWWEQKLEDRKVGEETKYEELDIDVEGQPIIDSATQQRAVKPVQVPIVKKAPVIDRFNYDILDPRNVFTDNKYVYSLQQKDYFFIRDEKTLEELEQIAADMNYYGLDELKQIEAANETETSESTYNKGLNSVKQEKPSKPVSKYFDVLDRFGKYWCIIKEREEDGYPKTVEPGIDEFGKVKENAELIETLITYVVKGSTKKCIRFDPLPYKDAEGNPYRPIIRGICYIHPTDDAGMGDGKHERELQLALDDTFNISNDRVMLATLPTFKTKKFSADDNTEIYIEPGHNIPLENPREDLEILQIPDNIQGAITQGQFLRNMMQQVDAIYPTTMGDVPGLASTTATAIAGSESRSNIRSNYKSLTFENTFLTELYWMILQMTWQFATPETGMKLAGEKIYNFNPTKDYFYKPISSAIESEYSKETKIKNYTSILGYIVNLQHPNMVNLVNYLLGKIFEYMGDEYANFGSKLLNPNVPITQQGGMAAQETRPEGVQGMMASNQNGMPMTGMEQGARGMM